MNVLNLASSSVVTSNLSICNADMDDVANVYSLVSAVPEFKSVAGIDPKVVMIVIIATFAITAIAFGAKFLGAL